MSEPYRYGPLVFASEEHPDGNYHWNGLQPVDYDDLNIPIDRTGRQCLPGTCILHPNHVPEQTEWNETLKADLPTVDASREWFADQFLDVSDYNLCRYILRWYWWNHQHDESWKSWKGEKSTEEMIGEIWPDVPKS